MPKPKEEQHIRLIKSVIIIGLLAGIFMTTGVVLSAYPQHLYLNNNSVIDALVGNFNNNSMNIRGNQVQYSTGSVIPLEGRDYIKITGNQIQLGDDTFTPAIRIISARVSQNVLFSQKIGTFGINSAGRATIDDVSINFIPVTKNILNIQTQDSNYNVEFVSGVVYLKSKNVMLKLVQNGGNIEVYIVGTSHYNNILFVTI